MASCERAMIERNEDLALPPRNEYIPTDFSLKIPEPKYVILCKRALFVYANFIFHDCFSILLGCWISF